MHIVDAQVHIWGADTPDRPWPTAHIEPHRPAPFSKDDLLREMDAAGVCRAVIVPPMWEGDRNDLGLEAARLHPDRFAVMVRIDVQTPASRSLLNIESMALNFTAVRRLTHSVLPSMLAHKWGRIINITGNSEPLMFNAAHSAKAAVHAWASRWRSAPICVLRVRRTLWSQYSLAAGATARKVSRWEKMCDKLPAA